MFNKYPELKPEEGQKVIAIHNEAAYATEYIKFNERVPNDELPEGIIHGIRKSEKCWFADVAIQKEDLEKLEEIDVWWTPFPEEAIIKKEEASEES